LKNKIAHPGESTKRCNGGPGAEIPFKKTTIQLLIKFLFHKTIIKIADCITQQDYLYFTQ
jgi:hypothetical protein